MPSIDPPERTSVHPVPALLQHSAAGRATVVEIASAKLALTPTYCRGGVRFAENAIDSNDALKEAGLTFYRCINAELGLNQQLNASIAVVQVKHNSRFAMLLVTSGVDDAVLEDLRDVVQAKGWGLPSEGPQAWLVTSQITVSVSQGHMGHSQNAQVRQIGTVDKQTHLWQSVLEVTQWALEQGANDIDYLLRMDEPTSQIAFKIDGRYVRPSRWAVPTPTMRQMLSVAWQRSSGGKDAQFQVHSEQQAGLEVNLPSGKTVRLRWSGMATDNGCAVTQRIQPPSTTLRTLEQAGCLAWQIGAFNRALKSRGGITTLAGEVGSGKSHTLASLMCMLNALYECKIVEVSSPVEIELPFAIQKTIIQDLAKTGDSSQIASAIRAILRSALDKLLLGEIRDVETGLLARAIIESRHSVFATTHASGALGIFAKYASPQVGIPLEVLAEPGNIRLNVFQSLLPTLCVCSITVEQHLDMHAHDRPAQESTQRFFDRVERLFNLPRERFKMRNPHGCPICNRVDLPMFTGLYGRTLVMEMVEPDEGLCELLQNNDRIGMGRYWRSLASGRFDDPMLAGKTAMECAVYKAQLGQIDLRDVESHFESFESVEYQRERRRAS